MNKKSTRFHVGKREAGAQINQGNKTCFFLTARGTWADLGQVFRLMRKMSLHMRKHPFLCYRKDHAQVPEWKGPGDSIHWSGTRSFPLGITRVRKPNTPALWGVTACTSSHSIRWDTGVCLSPWGCRSCHPVPCCVLTAPMFHSAEGCCWCWKVVD